MLKELMFERLRKIDDLEQRQLLKDVMSGVFVNLIDYQKDWNERLEDRIFNEIDDGENKYDVYVALSSKEEIDPIHDYLFPLIPSDVESQSIDIKQILKMMQNNEPVILSNLFLACDCREIEQINASQREFSGSLLTATGPIAIKVKLQKNAMYLQEVERLYFTYQLNGIPWRTINHPYIHKFFHVVLSECPMLPEDLEISGVTVDLEEYEDKKHVYMVPLWNIERHEVKNIGFPIAALDKVNYEHCISTRKLGTQHGYLVESDELTVRYVQHREDEVTIVSPRDKSGVWTVLKVTQVDEEKRFNSKYEILSNRRVENFTNKYVRNYQTNVKTKAEIIRLVNSFEVSQQLQLHDIEIVDAAPEDAVSYPVNHFLIEEMEARHKKVLLLSFERKGEDSFVSNDILSFLVSEVQRNFFEYKCMGKWL